MVFQSLFRRWIKRTRWTERLSQRPKRPVRGRRRARFAAGVEALEVRQLPSAVSWNTDASGYWDDPANWITSEGQQRVPNFGDTVTIDRGAANPIVTVRSDSATSSIFSTESLVISAGTLSQ